MPEIKVMVDAFDDVLDTMGIELDDLALAGVVDKIKNDMDSGKIESKSLEEVFSGNMPTDMSEFKEVVKDYIVSAVENKFLSDEGALDKLKSEYEREEKFNNYILDVIEDNKCLKEMFRKRNRKREGLFSIIRPELLKGNKLDSKEKKAVEKAFNGEEFDKDLFESAVLKYIPKNLKVDEEMEISPNEYAIGELCDNYELSEKDIDKFVPMFVKKVKELVEKGKIKEDKAEILKSVVLLGKKPEDMKEFIKVADSIASKIMSEKFDEECDDTGKLIKGISKLNKSLNLEMSEDEIREKAEKLCDKFVNDNLGFSKFDLSVYEALIKGKKISKELLNGLFKNQLDEEETNLDSVVYRFDGIIHPSKIAGLFNFREGKPFAFVPGINEEVELELIDEDGVSMIVVPVTNAEAMKKDLLDMVIDLYKDKLDYVNYSNFKVNHWGSDKMYCPKKHLRHMTDESSIDEGKKLDKERQEEYDFAIEQHKKAKDCINSLIEIAFNYSKDHRKYKNNFTSVKDNLDKLLYTVRDCLFDNE